MGESMKEIENGRILLFDGAMGTYLASEYEDSIVRCELANIRHPQRVIRAHRDYIEADVYKRQGRRLKNARACA